MFVGPGLQTHGAKPSAMVAVCKPYADRMSFKSVIAAPGMAKFVQDEAPPRDPAQLKGYLKRVPFKDRGLGLVIVDERDKNIVQLRKENEKVARSNGALYTKVKNIFAKDKAARQELRKGAGLRPTQPV